MKPAASLLAAVPLLLAGSFAAGRQAERAQNASGDPYELMYLPEGQVLRAASLGNRSFLADLVWLRTIQYYGEQRLTTRNYDQAERLFQVIYDLAPRFKGATRFGALVLSQDAGNPEAALGLLQRASDDDPTAWEYPFDAGFIYQTVVRDYQKAGAAYERAAALPGAPELAARLAGLSFARLGDRSSAREIWREILDGAENDLMRAVAERNLKNLDLADAEDTLTDAVLRYRAARGGLPANWEEMVRLGALAAVPTDPFGGAFFWDPGTERVYSSTTVDRSMAIARTVFARGALMYRAKHGSFPGTLDDVVGDGLVKSPAWEPFGLSLEYDPASGHVAWNPPWPEIEPRMHGAGEVTS